MLQAQFRSKRLGEKNSQPHKLTKNRNGVFVFGHKKHFRKPLVSLREWSGGEGIEVYASHLWVSAKASCVCVRQGTSEKCPFSRLLSPWHTYFDFYGLSSRACEAKRGSGRVLAIWFLVMKKQMVGCELPTCRFEKLLHHQKDRCKPIMA